ncbi:MAG: hypothetical protein ACI8W8_002267 [Rhodothermales bacterium]
MHRSGYWPVVLGPLESLFWEDESYTDDYLGLVLAKEVDVDFDSWIRAELAKWEAEVPTGTWPELPFVNNTFTVPLIPLIENEQDDACQRRSEIGLFPIRNPWEVGAFFPQTGNCDHRPEFHVAALRRWHDRFGAEPVCCAGNTIEVQVHRRPTSRKEAIELAWEQYLYASDAFWDRTIFHEGREFESTCDLAGSLTVSNVWWLWWD